VKYITRIVSELQTSNPKRYLRSAYWIILSRILSLGVSLIATFYIARTLGPQNFGELSYATSIVSLLSFFAALASSTVLTRDLTRNPTSEQTILGSAWLIAFSGTIVTTILIAIFVILFPHDQLTILVIAIIAMAQFLASFQITQNYFIVHTETKLVSIAQLAVHITISLAKIIAMTYHQGVLVLAGILFLEQVLIACSLIFLYWRTAHHTPLAWKVDRQYAKKLAFDSLPFVIITLSSTISGRIDQVFIKQMIDTSTVGIYNVAVQLTEVWQVIPLMFLAALYPALVNVHQTKNVYNKRLLALFLTLTFYSIAASAVTFFIAPYFIPLIYGAAFISSIPLVQIYCWALFGTVSGYLATNYLITENKRTAQIVVGLIPMVVNVILNIAWIPTYGATGAAWATVISYSCTPIIAALYYFAHNKRQTKYA